MVAPQKTVFISYRRVNGGDARNVYMDLRHNGWDVFMDVEGLDAGPFDTSILREIEVRTHFILILTPGALDRCNNSGDWLRREIEHAIKHQRKIIPLVYEGFSWESAKPYLTGDLVGLDRHNSLPINYYYFEAGMDKLRTRFLSRSINTISNFISAVEGSDIKFIQAEFLENGQKSDDLTEQAFKHIDTGKYDLAINDATDAILLNEKNAQAYNARGSAFYHKKYYERAITDITKAIEIAPEYTSAYNNRGRAYIAKKDYDRAIGDYTHSIDIYPNYSDTHNSRGIAYRGKNNDEEALRNFNKAIEIEPRALYYKNRADTYRKLDRIAEAEADEQKAKELPS